MDNPEAALFRSDAPKRKHLYRNENFWVDVQPFLLAQGYELRPRYRPDWVPSWTVAWRFNGRYEDTHPVFHVIILRPSSIRELHFDQKRVLDATCIRDGKKVVLKRLQTDSQEIQFVKYLDSHREDPRNRTIPILDIIVMPERPWSFLVMPYCRKFTYPPFHCLNEFLEAMTQYLEGLQFMHNHNLVHFDIAPQNMVMDEVKVVPQGSHFSNDKTHNGFILTWFGWNTRCSVKPVDYYYIDFGLSLYYPDGKDSAQMTGLLRTFRTIPELSLTVPYNPFFVDIFQLGLTMHKLIDDYIELEAFRPVAESMTAADPISRPTADEALAHLRRIASDFPPARLAEQIWRKDMRFWQRVSCRVWGGYTPDP